jgi:hypothetical protein
LRDVPCESHGIHTASVPWKPGRCAADGRWQDSNLSRHRHAER